MTRVLKVGIIAGIWQPYLLSLYARKLEPCVAYWLLPELSARNSKVGTKNHVQLQVLTNKIYSTAVAT
jgi:hypothetical protein